MAETIPLRNFGSGDRRVTAIGLGGEGILRTSGRIPHARKVIRAALDLGITYFDSAPAYQESEVYLGSVWQENPAVRLKVFQASKSARRDREGALADLDNTLKRLHTDYLDLWQIHDIRTKQDFERISGPNGALEAFVAARKAGKVLNIGVTGHHDPRILSRAVSEWPVNSVMLPVNPVESILGGFLTTTLKEAQRKKIAVIGMKILGASHYILPKYDITAGDLIRYALSFPLTVGIVGCSAPDEVRTLVKAGSSKPLLQSEMDYITGVFKPYSRRLAFYRGVL